MQRLACKVTGTWSASELGKTARYVNKLINIVTDPYRSLQGPLQLSLQLSLQLAQILLAS